jgi:hypothetical protein
MKQLIYDGFDGTESSIPTCLGFILHDSHVCTLNTKVWIDFFAI